MRATSGAIALALATGVLGWSLGDRNKVRNHPDPTIYQPALYSLHIGAVDSVSGEPLAIKVSWDDKVSPLEKCRGPCRIEEFADGSQAIHVVGRRLADGLTFTIRAEGYEPESLAIQGLTGGVATVQPDDVTVLKLVKSSAND